MPHGAYDLAAVRSDPSARLAVVGAAYLGVMAASVIALLIAPAAWMVAFLAVSAAHFGLSDHPGTRGRRPSGVRDHLTGLALGLVVIGLPFALRPDSAWAPFGAIAAALGSGAAPLAGALAAVGWGAALSGAVGIVLSVASPSMPGAVRIETLGLLAGSAAIGLLVPPLLAVGLYFVLVHSSGHCLRATTPSRGAVTATARHAAWVHRRSLSLLLPSVAIVVCTAPLFGDRPFVEAISLSFLLFCSCATLAHHLLWSGLMPGCGTHGRRGR